MVGVWWECDGSVVELWWSVKEWSKNLKCGRSVIKWSVSSRMGELICGGNLSWCCAVGKYGEDVCYMWEGNEEVVIE